MAHKRTGLVDFSSSGWIYWHPEFGGMGPGSAWLDHLIIDILLKPNPADPPLWATLLLSSAGAGNS